MTPIPGDEILVHTRRGPRRATWVGAAVDGRPLVRFHGAGKAVHLDHGERWERRTDDRETVG